MKINCSKSIYSLGEITYNRSRQENKYVKIQFRLLYGIIRKKCLPVYHKSWMFLFTFFHIIYDKIFIYVNLSSKDILKLKFN